MSKEETVLVVHNVKSIASMRVGHDIQLLSAININLALMLVIHCHWILGLFVCAYEFRTRTLEI